MTIIICSILFLIGVAGRIFKPALIKVFSPWWKKTNKIYLYYNVGSKRKNILIYEW